MCSFGNTAKFEGGGVYQSESETCFDHCVFHQNSSGAAGGGVSNDSSKPTFTNCVFAGNEGGALYIYQSNPVFANCLFSGNSAFVGSAAFLYLGKPTTFNSCSCIIRCRP